METTTKRKFISASGISENGYVIVTITRLESPTWVILSGSVGNDPFVFGAASQAVAVRKSLDSLYERHPLSRHEIDEAVADALARITLPQTH